MKNALLSIFTFITIAVFSQQLGSLDNNFGTHGKVITNLGNKVNEAMAMLIQPDGKILVGGRSGLNTSDYKSALVRYNIDGSLDSTFGTNGKTLTYIPNHSVINSLAIHPDGRIVSAGYCYNTKNGLSIISYKANGTLDSTFSGDGIFTKYLPNSVTAYSVALQTDGKVVIVGDEYNSTSNNFYGLMARYDSVGVLDTSFGLLHNGYNTVSLSSNTEHFYSTAILPDGKILAAGETRSGGTYNFMVWRYDVNGRKDTSFGYYASGFSVMYFDATHDEQKGMAIQQDGKILLVGQTNKLSGDSMDFLLARYNANGTIDSTFGLNSRVVTDFNGLKDIATSVQIQPDGKIVVAGYTGTLWNYDFALARYYANGTPDSTFGTNGKVVIEVGTNQNTANSVAIQPDGKILAAGTAFGDTGSLYFAMVRFDATASCIAAFVVHPDSLNQGIYYGYNQSIGSNLNYLWYFGDGDSSNLQYPSHVYAAPGNYYVCLTVTEGSGCINTYCDSSFYVFKTEGGLMTELHILDPNAPNGIKDVNNNLKITVSPNPATNQLFIQTNGTSVSEVNIYNTTGSLVNQTKQPPTKSIDISQLANGVYIAEIKTKETSVMRRWVKM